jgi:hypothetical protein
MGYNFAQYHIYDVLFAVMLWLLLVEIAFVPASVRYARTPRFEVPTQ